MTNWKCTIWQRFCDDFMTTFTGTGDFHSLISHFYSDHDFQIDCDEII